MSRPLFLPFPGVVLNSPAGNTVLWRNWRNFHPPPPTRSTDVPTVHPLHKSTRVRQRSMTKPEAKKVKAKAKAPSKGVGKVKSAVY